MKHVVLAAGLVLLGAGCSSLEVNHDFDSQANFTQYKTYAWMPAPSGQQPANQLVAQRIERAIVSELAGKGLQESATDPDLLLAYHTGTKDKIQVTDWGYTYGSYYWGWGGRSVDVYQYEEGTLVVDLVDAKSKQLVWRGWATGTIDRTQSPEAIESKINDAVAQIMKRYPPEPE